MVGNDAIKNEFERSVANVDAMKYKCWRTKKSFLNSFLPPMKIICMNKK